MFKSAQRFAAQLSQDLNKHLPVGEETISLGLFGPIVIIPPYEPSSAAIPGQGQHTAVVLGPVVLVRDEIRWHIAGWSRALRLMQEY